MPKVSFRMASASRVGIRRTDQHGTEKSSVRPHRGTVDHHAKPMLRTEGNFQRDGAVLTRANERRRDRGPSTAGRARPNERTSGEPAGGRRRRPGWTRALNALTITYPGRRPRSHDNVTTNQINLLHRELDKLPSTLVRGPPSLTLTAGTGAILDTADLVPPGTGWTAGPQAHKPVTAYPGPTSSSGTC